MGLLERGFVTGMVVSLAACGGGTATSQPPAPVVVIAASPSTILTGQITTLTWNAHHANSCAASGSWSGSPPIAGSHSFSLSSPGNYAFILTCHGPGGNNESSTTVSVRPTTDSVPVSLSASPMSVAVGHSSTLTWSSSGADSCTASGAWSSGPKATSGSQLVTAANVGANIFQLDCTGSAGAGSQQVDVEGIAPTLTLSASPTAVAAGASSTLAWTATNADSCTASGEWSGAKATSGNAAVTVGSIGQHTYTLTCAAGGATVSQNVTVTAMAPTLSIGVFPPTATVGDDATVTWSSGYTQTCAASGAWSGTQLTSGTKTVTISAPGTLDFVLQCSNSDGQVSKTASVTGAAAAAYPPATAYQVTVNHAGVVNFSGSVNYPKVSTWSRTFAGPVSYPLIVGGRVFVTVANSSSYGTQLYALDEDTGATVWGPMQISGTYYFSNATYESGKVFVINSDGMLRSFDAATGANGWSTNLPGQYMFSAPPTAYGGLVFVGGAGSGGTVYAVDETNGQVIWTQSVQNGDDSSPALTSSGLYVTYPCQAYDIAPMTGALLWNAQNGCEGGGGRSSVVKDNVLYGRYFAVSNGSLTFFAAATGEQIGSSSSETIPAVSSTQMFTMNSGTLQAISLSTGKLSWSFSGDGQLTSAPIVINDRVIVGSATGAVFALSAASGATLWTSAAGAGINAPDEQNFSAPRTGLAAGDGYLVVPAGSTLTGWKLKP